MINTSTISPTPAWKLRFGYALSGLVIIFMLMDAAMKLMRLPIVLEATAQLGWPSDSAMPLGVLLLVCTVLYGWPRTSALGAVLLTGYLGGAIATHARIGSPLFSHTLFGVYLGVLLWAGLYLRDPRIRALLAPDRRQPSRVSGAVLVGGSSRVHSQVRAKLSASVGRVTDRGRRIKSSQL